MIKKLLQKPHLFFFGLVPVFILIALFKGNKPIDLNIHDVYFISDVKFWSFISAIFFSLIGLNYYSLFWAKKQPKKWLTIIHITLQIIILVPFIYFLLSEDNFKNHQLHQYMMVYLFVAFLLFLISILIHLINFFVSLLLKNE